jgi:hypothetical protein
MLAADPPKPAEAGIMSARQVQEADSLCNMEWTRLIRGVRCKAVVAKKAAATLLKSEDHNF